MFFISLICHTINKNNYIVQLAVFNTQQNAEMKNAHIPVLWKLHVSRHSNSGSLCPSIPLLIFDKKLHLLYFKKKHFLGFYFCKAIWALFPVTLAMQP